MFDLRIELKKVALKVQEILEIIRDIKEALYDSGWIKTTNGIQEVKYRRRNGWVYVHIRHSPTVISGTTWGVVYTLPEGFRPSEDLHVHCDNSGSTRGMQAKVNANGQIEIYSSGTTQHFNVVGTFPVGGGTN